MRNFKNILSQIWNRDEGNIRVTIFALLAIFLVSFDPFGLKNYMHEIVANILYFTGSLFISYGFSTFYETYFVHQFVKIVPNSSSGESEYVPVIKGYYSYSGLDVVIPKGWEITDCYITLEKAIAIYYEDGVLLPRKDAEFLSKITKPEFKILQWKSPLVIDSYKFNVGENSDRETFWVGKIVYGELTDVVNNIPVSINTFDFCLINKTKGIKFNRMGLYEISLSLHWIRNGIKRITNFDGYIYSAQKDGIRKILVHEGNYNNDREVPQPLLEKPKEIDELHEQPKQKSKKNNQGTDKKKPPSLKRTSSKR